MRNMDRPLNKNGKQLKCYYIGNLHKSQSKEHLNKAAKNAPQEEKRKRKPQSHNVDDMVDRAAPKNTSQPSTSSIRSVTPASMENRTNTLDADAVSITYGPEYEKVKLGPQTSWSQLFYDFSQRTTLHGMPNFGMPSAFIMRKVLWFFMVMGSLSFFTYYTSSRLDIYFQFKKIVNVEVAYLSNLTFPQITICNQNTFRLSDAVNNGWYDTARALMATHSSSGAHRRCQSPREFTCQSDELCISASLRCNTFPDCRDWSDEMNCDVCPYIEVLTNAPEGAPVLKGFYTVQPNTFTHVESVYMSDIQPYTFLYKNEESWIFADGLPPINIFAKVTNNATSADVLGGVWSVNNNGVWNDQEFSISCGKAYPFLGVTAESNITGDLNLQMLYNITSHDQNELIRSCSWLGEPCDYNATRPVYTDVGLCTTLNFTQQYVTLPGPGNGLTVTTNIEAYDYMQSTKDGIGILLAIHSPYELPNMKEVGQAVSPGLASFVSIETTTREILKPPWGKCGTSELEFFSNYTKSRCVVDCETKFVEKTCDCRTLNMPHKNGLPRVCTVAEYLNCVAPELKWFRAANNSCDCPIICLKNEYVPSTSFSVMVSSSLDLQDARNVFLKERLDESREIRYRVEETKFRETIKIFHAILEELKMLIKFIHVVNSTLQQEYDDAQNAIFLALDDCRLTRDVFTRAEDMLNLRVVPALQTLKMNLNNVATHMFPKNVDNAARWKEVMNGTLNSYLNDTYYCNLIGCDLNITRWRALEIEPLMLDANDTRFDHLFRCHNETWKYHHGNQSLEIYHNGTVCYNTTVECNFTLYVNETLETYAHRPVCCNITNEYEVYDLILELYQDVAVCYNATIECNERVIMYENGTVCCNASDGCMELQDLYNTDNMCCNDTFFETCEDILLFGDCDHQLWRTLSQQNETLGISFSRLQIAIQDLMNDQSLLPIIDELRLPQFVVSETLLDPLRVDVGNYCLWCQNDHVPVLELVRVKLKTFYDDVYSSTLLSINERLNEGFEKYEATSWILHELNQTLVTELEVLVALLQNLYPEIIRVFDNTGDAINMVNDVTGYIKDIKSYSYRLHCETQLTRLSTEYTRKHRSSMDILNNFDRELQTFVNDIQNKLSMYLAESMTLTQIASTFKLKKISQHLQENKLKIDTSLNARVVVFNAIESEINQIYYIAMTQLNRSFIAERSVFWNHFKITDPKFRMPTTKTIDTIDFPLSDFGMVPEGELLDFWRKVHTNTNDIFPRLQLQKDGMDLAISRATLYFSEFLMGSELGETFSRQNFLSVDIFMKELTKRKVTQNKAFTLPNLVSEVGGLMGLLLGGSAITLIELMDFGCYNIFRKIFSK